jgi:hypothetical protein
VNPVGISLFQGNGDLGMLLIIEKELLLQKEEGRVLTISDLFNYDK